MIKVRIGLFLIALIVLTLSASGNAQEFRALWVDTWHSGIENSTATQTMVNYHVGANCNAVIAEVRKRGDAYYASTLEPTGINVTPAAGYDSLSDLCTKAHAAGLEVHAWVVVYRVWTSQTAPAQTTPNHVFNTHPEWFNLTNTGAKFDATNNSFLDPGHPGVEDFLKSVCMEIVTNYPIDGLVLDYIRYPGTTWGYNTTSVARYNAEYGLSGNPVYTDTQWSNWRRDQVTNMVKRIYLEAKAVKPGIKIGAAVWKTAASGNSGYFQNWDTWMSGHILDYSCPMNYTATNSTFDSQCDDSYIRQYGRHIYIAQGAYLNTISNSMWQIRDVQTIGFPGVTPYSYYQTNSGTIDRTGFQSALIASGGPFQYDEAVPAMSWISSPTLGMLKGFVKDAGGAAVYPATVTVSTKSTKNTGTGFYGIVDISPGTYTVTATASIGSASGQATITAGQVTSLNLTIAGDIIIDNSSGSFSASANWATGTSATDKYGADYRYRSTEAVSDPAQWTPNIPTSGNWAVYAWWSQGTNRSTSAPYIVTHSAGTSTVYVNQQANGGKWNLLGTYSFGTGTGYPTKLSCWTTTGYVVIADAIKWVKQ